MFTFHFALESRVNFRLSAFLFSTLLLSACQQSPSNSDSVRICTEQGCSWRAKSEMAAEVVTQDPAATAQIEALQAQAETSPKASFDLGLRYFRGDGLRQDSYQALVWMRRAAEGGDLQAQKALGSFYLLGMEEMGADPIEAEKWLRMAAASGDEESRQLLSVASSAATAERKSGDEYYKWKTRWSEYYQSYWYSGYSYYGRWDNQVWYGY